MKVQEPTVTPGHKLVYGQHIVIGPNIFKVLNPPADENSAGSAALAVGKAHQRNLALWGYNSYNALPLEAEVTPSMPAQVVAGGITTGAMIVGRDSEEVEQALEQQPQTTAPDVLAQANLEPNALKILEKAAAKPAPNTKKP